MVTKKPSNFIPFAFHKFGNFDCHLNFLRLIDRNSDKVKVDIIAQTNEEQISTTYGCIGFNISYRFLSMELDGLVETLDKDDLKILKQDFHENWSLLSKKSTHPNEDF